MRRPHRLVALAITAVFAVSCGDDGPAGPENLQDHLVFTRADGSVITFGAAPSVDVWCGEWEQDFDSTQALHLIVRAPPSDGSRWELRAVIADVTLGTPFTFPNTFVSDAPEGVDIFVSDPPNELSTQDERSQGEITFQQLRCGTGGGVQFSIDAVVGSEFGDGPSVTIAGTFASPVGQAPAPGKIFGR